MNYSVVLPCAGIGSRMQLGYNKLLYKMKNGKTVLENTISIFLEDVRCQELILVVGKNDEATIQKMMDHPKIKMTLGGDTRQESVYHGLLKVTSEIVLVHDGARPFLKKEKIDAVLDCLKKHRACLLMVPSKDTLKVVSNGVVIETPDRSKMYQAQTPQAFHTNIVLEAFKQAEKKNYLGTDDASLVEKFSDVKVHVVEGDYDNIKITTKEDLNHPGFDK